MERKVSIPAIQAALLRERMVIANMIYPIKQTASHFIQINNKRYVSIEIGKVLCI